MAKGPETRLQKKIQDGIKKSFPDSFFFKSHGGKFQVSGLPDLIGCINGKFIGIEVKMPDKIDTVTELQRACIHKINESGGIAFVAWSVEQAIQSLNERL